MFSLHGLDVQQGFPKAEAAGALSAVALPPSTPAPLNLSASLDTTSAAGNICEEGTMGQQAGQWWAGRRFAVFKSYPIRFQI